MMLAAKPAIEMAPIGDISIRRGSHWRRFYYCIIDSTKVVIFFVHI